MTRYQDNSTDAADEIAALDAWFASIEQPCFQGEDFYAYQHPTALSAQLRKGFNRLSGTRTMIIVPMGGAIPASIPYPAAVAWLENQEFDPLDWEPILDLWDEMDGIASDFRDGTHDG